MRGLWYWIKRLKADIFVVYYALKDPRVPREAKLLLFMLLAYLISPIDLVPDLFVPVLGYVDDLVLIPVGVEFALRLIPEPLAAELRDRSGRLKGKVKTWWGAALAAVVILLALVLLHRFLQL